MRWITRKGIASSIATVPTVLILRHVLTILSTPTGESIHRIMQISDRTNDTDVELNGQLPLCKSKFADRRSFYTSKNETYAKLYSPFCQKDDENSGYNAESSSYSIKSILIRNTRKFHDYRVNCESIISGNRTEIEFANERVPNQFHFDSEFLDKAAAHYMRHASTSCEDFIRHHGFIMDPLTAEEKDFPIAFSVLTYGKINMALRLLAAIYRPQNFYCIHVDIKAKDDFKMAMEEIASCFPNVEIAVQSLNITWGNWTIVQAEINCMHQLYKHRSWRYFINLTGHEFPIKTNFELVKILKSYNGANDVDGGIERRRFWRWQMSPTPPSITVYMGSTHIAVNRDFVHFVLFSEISEVLQKWLRPTRVPDETFFATINHNRVFGIKGSYTGSIRDVEVRHGKKPTFTRYKMWLDEKTLMPEKGMFCYDNTAWTRSVCQLGMGDLQRIVKSPFMFANKFKPGRDPLVVSCLEQWFSRRTLQFYLGQATIDTSVYEESTIVKDQLI